MINGTAQEFQKMASQANQMVMDSWSNWTKQTIQSESFASSAGALMDWSLATHKMMTELQGQFMESMDIPKRSDLARISAQVQSLESRVMEQDDAQEDIRDLLVAISSKLDKIATAPAPAPATAAAAAPVAPAEVSPAPAKKAVAKSVQNSVATVTEAVESAKGVAAGKTKKPRTTAKSKAKKAGKKS